MSFGKMNVDYQARVDFDRLRKQRLERAHKMLKKYGLGSAMVYNWDSRRYLTSIFEHHSYARHMPLVSLVGYALLIRDQGFPYVTADPKLDMKQLEETCPWLKGKILTPDQLPQPDVIRMAPRELQEERWLRTAEKVKQILKENGVADLPLGVDYTSPYMIKAFEKVGIQVVDGNSWIQEARMIKTDDEVELMKLSATCNEAAYAALVQKLRPGMRESDVAAIMAKAVYEAGAEYYEGFVINSGPRTAPRHFGWSDRTIRPGEFVSVEICHVTFCGYKTCYDRTFFVGAKPSELDKEIYQTVVEMHRKIQKILRPGITTHDVSKERPFPTFPPSGIKTAEDVRHYRSSWSNHFGGIGIGWNEPPYLSAEEPPVTLEKNMTIAYHALFWIEGYQGVAIENTYRITDGGCECLTKWPYEEIIVCGYG